MYRYFAYGSALSKRHVAEWASEHGVDARVFDVGVPAVLRGYKLVFDVESRFWGGRVANLAVEEGGTVHGVLFDIPDDMQDAIARKEGVPTGLSQEIDVTVESGAQSIAANAFVARPEKRTTPGPASPRLLEYLIEGAQERGLPAEWVAALRKHQAPSAGVKLGMKR
jgi:gamma-glutamylcyclotransferase